jgi:hypothetical protein
MLLGCSGTEGSVQEVVLGALPGFRTLFPKRIDSTVPKRNETPENRRYAVPRRITHYA